MKSTKILGFAAVAALALMAFASSASATTLEIGGVTQNKAVTIKASIASGGSVLWTDTFGVAQNNCTASTIEGTTVSQFTGATTVGAPVSTLAWTGCSQGNPTVHKKGSLSIEWLSGTNGTVRSSGAEYTLPAPFGSTFTCTTSGTDFGTLNGVKTGNATITINAVLACTGVGTAKWTGTYTVTSPSGLGVEA